MQNTRKLVVDNAISSLGFPGELQLTRKSKGHTNRKVAQTLRYCHVQRPEATKVACTTR